MTRRLAPYPAYKDSGVPWLGEAPAHWCLTPGFSVFREKQHKNAGMAETTVLSLSYGKVVVKDKEKLHGLVPESFETYQIVDPGEIIIRPTDLQNDHVSLRVGAVRDRGIITSAYLCLRTVGQMHADYGYLLLHAYDLKKVFYGMGSGLRQNLDFSDFKRMPALVPPPEDQQAIARFLDHVDRRINQLIRAKRRLIELLNEQRRAIVHRAVTRGLDPSVRLKASGIAWLGDVPEHWEIRRIKQTSRIVRGKFSHRPRNDPDFYGGAYPFIQTGDVSRAEKFVKVHSQTLNEKGLAVSKMFPSGTLLMTIAANIGDVAILTFDACFPDSVIGFVPRREMLQGFLLLSLRCMKPELVKEAPVNTQGNLSVERLGAMSLCVPPTEEQQVIVDVVEDSTASLSSAIVRARREIELLREYRTRLIADVVTGKLDVRGVELVPLDMDGTLDEIAAPGDGDAEEPLDSGEDGDGAD